MLRQSPTRIAARSTSALAEFHALAGHAGPADSCQDCQATQQRQRLTATALRAHQRHARQQVDAILAAICPGCAQTPCACTDEPTDLRLEADLFDPGEDDEQPWGSD